MTTQNSSSSSSKSGGADGVNRVCARSKKNLFFFSGITLFFAKHGAQFSLSPEKLTPDELRAKMDIYSFSLSFSSPFTFVLLNNNHNLPFQSQQFISSESVLLAGFSFFCSAPILAKSPFLIPRLRMMLRRTGEKRKEKSE